MKKENSYEDLYGITILGYTNVGKSALLGAFTDKEFSSEYVSTIGCDFGIQIIDIVNTRTKFMIWDTSGDESFRSITSSYIRGAQGIVLVYDITSKTNFPQLTYFSQKIFENSHCNSPVLLIGNKCDLYREREIKFEQGFEFASERGWNFMEISAKTKHNVHELFSLLAEELWLLGH